MQGAGPWVGRGASRGEQDTFRQSETQTDRHTCSCHRCISMPRADRTPGAPTAPGPGCLRLVSVGALVSLSGLVSPGLRAPVLHGPALPSTLTVPSSPGFLGQRGPLRFPRGAPALLPGHTHLGQSCLSQSLARGQSGKCVKSKSIPRAGLGLLVCLYESGHLRPLHLSHKTPKLWDQEAPSVLCSPG